jgi:hypothetical protein
MEVNGTTANDLYTCLNACNNGVNLVADHTQNDDADIDRVANNFRHENANTNRE